LLAAQFDLKLIPWFEVQQTGISLADQQIPIALNGCHVTEFASCLAFPTGSIPKVDTLGFQKSFIVPCRPFSYLGSHSYERDQIWRRRQVP
jgi:hypothetical protein